MTTACNSKATKATCWLMCGRSWDDQHTDYIDEYDTIDADHGRIEERSYRVYNVPQYLTDIHNWPHLQAFVHVVSRRTTGDKTSRSERLYLLSKCLTAQAAASLIRGHWQIENSLHWSLDVVMNDDQHRARKDHAPANFAALRRIALNIIKANSAKGSNRGKFKKAGWSNEFLKNPHPRHLKRDCPAWQHQWIDRAAH